MHRYVLQNLHYHRNVGWKTGCVMSVWIHQNLSQIQLVNCHWLASGNGQLAQPTTDCLEVGHPLVIDTFVSELEPSVQNLVSNVNHGLLKSRQLFNQLIEDLHTVVLGERNSLEHNVICQQFQDVFVVSNDFFQVFDFIFDVCQWQSVASSIDFGKFGLLFSKKHLFCLIEGGQNVKIAVLCLFCHIHSRICMQRFFI